LFFFGIGFAVMFVVFSPPVYDEVFDFPRIFFFFSYELWPVVAFV